MQSTFHELHLICPPSNSLFLSSISIEISYCLLSTKVYLESKAGVLGLVVFVRGERRRGCVVLAGWSNSVAGHGRRLLGGKVPGKRFVAGLWQKQEGVSQVPTSKRFKQQAIKCTKWDLTLRRYDGTCARVRPFPASIFSQKNFFCNRFFEFFSFSTTFFSFT